jgi:hypothetical protein
VCGSLFCLGEAEATVKSATGNIYFDANSDSTPELTLNSTGLGIGISPAANLHVAAGNTLISDSLIVGGTSNPSSSNLHIHGTMGLLPDTFGAGGNAIARSLVLADTSAGNVTLILPDISSSVGSLIVVKRTSLLNQLFISGAGNTIDASSTLAFMAGNLTSLTLFNGGSSWYLMSLSKNENPVETAASNLFLWWKLDESSGNTISDSSGLSRSGVLTHDHTFDDDSYEGAAATALHLDDPDDEGLYSGGNISSAAYSYALWAKYSAASSDTIRYEPEIEGTAGFVWASGNALFHKSAYHQISGGSYVTTALTSELSADTWYHSAVTWTGSLLSLSLNGVSQSGNTAASWTGASNISLTNPGTTYDNELSSDDLRFFDTALSEDEIRSLFYAGNP